MTQNKLSIPDANQIITGVLEGGVHEKIHEALQTTEEANGYFSASNNRFLKGLGFVWEVLGINKRNAGNNGNEINIHQGGIL